MSEANTTTVVTPLNPSNLVTSRPGIQVQIMPSQAGINNDANGPAVHTVTPTLQTSLVSTSSLLPSVSSINQDVSSQITQLTGLRLPADQQQKLLLAAQIQHLTKSNVGTSLPVNASFVLQSAFPGGITVVSTAPQITASDKM